MQLLLVIVLGLIPRPPGLGSGLDGVAHFMQFAVLMTWFGGIANERHHWIIAFLLAALGTAIEFGQGLSIYRQFDTADILANVLGVGAGFLLARTVMQDWCWRIEARLSKIST